MLRIDSNQNSFEFIAITIGFANVNNEIISIRSTILSNNGHLSISTESKPFIEFKKSAHFTINDFAYSLFNGLFHV